MKEFINITEYNNFRSEGFNKVEEFFTRQIIEFLEDLPKDKVGSTSIKSIKENNEIQICKVFSVEEGKWEGVEVEVTLRYIESIDNKYFSNYCFVSIRASKNDWEDSYGEYEDNIVYHFSNFPTQIIPKNIIEIFEPIYLMPEYISRIDKLERLISDLEKVKDKSNNDKLNNFIDGLKLDLEEFRKSTRYFPFKLIP